MRFDEISHCLDLLRAGHNGNSEAYDHCGMIIELAIEQGLSQTAIQKQKITELERQLFVQGNIKNEYKKIAFDLQEINAAYENIVKKLLSDYEGSKTIIKDLGTIHVKGMQDAKQALTNIHIVELKEKSERKVRSINANKVKTCRYIERDSLIREIKQNNFPDDNNQSASIKIYDTWDDYYELDAYCTKPLSPKTIQNILSKK